MPSVLSNLPIYYFSLFKCPASIIKRIERRQREFLWYGNKPQKKYHLRDWDSICKPKEGSGNQTSEADESSPSGEVAMEDRRWVKWPMETGVG